MLITDMKMPIMDRIQLLRNLHESQSLPCTVVLSSYDDFKMVRESFRLGACDYLLKADISEEMLETLLTRLNQDFPKEEEESELHQEDAKDKTLVDMAMGRRSLDLNFYDRLLPNSI